MIPDLKKNVEAVMKDRTGAPGKGLDVLLRGAAKLYGGVVDLRSRLYDRGALKTSTLPCKVVSIGNITVGGTGKTPMTIFLADSLKRKHIKPVILSRGYGGTATDSGGMVTDGQTLAMDSVCSGDEPFLMASLLEGVPVFVGKRRMESAMEACLRFHPDVFILDDGFQHRALHRDVDILLFDAEHPLGNGFLLPRGELREPVSNLERGDLFVLTRAERRDIALKHFRECLERFKVSEKVRKTPVFTCRHKPAIRGVVKAGSSVLGGWDVDQSGYGDSGVIAFSGIAKNDDFRKSLSACGFSVRGFLDYPDHHAFSTKDIETAARMADSRGVRLLSTTEKDFVRFQDRIILSHDLVVMGVDIDFHHDDGQMLLDDVLGRLALP